MIMHLSSSVMLLLSIPLMINALAIEPRDRTFVILYHKPPNVITSHSNNDAVSPSNTAPRRRTVYQDIESMEGYVGEDKIIPKYVLKEKLHAIGRLDADTTGLLLLTNDGGLVHHVTNPTASTHNHNSIITKTYQATIMGHHTMDDPDMQKILHEGVDIGNKHGGMTRPAVALEVLDHPTPKSTLVQLTIAEGRNRQVRRVFHAIGSGVMKLARVSVGPLLQLGGLQQGQWRILTDEEVREGLNWEPRQILVSTVVSNEKRQRGAGNSNRKRIFGTIKSRRSSNRK